MISAADQTGMFACYLAAQVKIGDDVHEVHLTRLGTDRALLNGELPLKVGGRGEVAFDHPDDGSPQRLAFRVTRVRRDGQQWGWKPSFHLAFDRPLAAALARGEADDEPPARGDGGDSDGDGGDEEPALPDGVEPTPPRPPLPTGETQDPPVLAEGPAPDITASQSADAFAAWAASAEQAPRPSTVETMRSLSEELRGETRETPTVAPPPHEDAPTEEVATTATPDYREEDTADEILAEQLASHLAKALEETAPDETDDEIAVPRLGADPDGDEDPIPLLHGISHDPDDEPAPPAVPGRASLEERPEEAPAGAPDDDPDGDLTPGGTAVPPWERDAAGNSLPRRATAATPWSDRSGDDPGRAGRPSRILSQTPAAYTWAGERRFGAIQDFSRQGLFVAVMDGAPLPPPGAVVRVEFALAMDREHAQLQLTAEVRWLHGEGSEHEPGRGMGLQIADFASAAQRRIYERHVEVILRDA